MNDELLRHPRVRAASSRAAVDFTRFVDGGGAGVYFKAAKPFYENRRFRPWLMRFRLKKKKVSSRFC